MTQIPSDPVARVLVVDDRPDMCFLVQSMLDLMGVAADVAGDGRKAVEMATSETYAVILMDIEMPEMDGLDATRAIRARRLDHVPIIGMTGHRLEAIHRLGKMAGMDDLIVKPFQIDALHAKLKAVCGEALVLDDI